MANTRRLYHDSGCRYVEIGPKDKSDCAQCRGSGIRNEDQRCYQCNGHGWLWDNGGYAFTPYTLIPVYN